MTQVSEWAAKAEEKRLLGCHKAGDTIRASDVTITLPAVGGVTYAFQGGQLFKDGKPQPVRER
ncbi:hypothetical protein [Methylobacterium platani]|uniref:Uncharacterized protein n=2 Tax=Methylobacterium platani TaxID=427683 RepID=A0A179SFG7_9HYPH|nr:hypothetical protein [Methylobacterium platani]KMO21389.1 hypothetical protein SQ03_03280 [Methylobacterium platani JCM 14648]OAS26335.1 hypothetical protein A5481_06365 [Methylobacterium platani]